MFRERIKQAITDLPTLDRRDAAILADRIIDVIIEALQRDRALPGRTTADWTIALASTRHRVAELIVRRLVGRINRDEALAALDEVL
jgi:hypothetical protein